MTREIFDLQQHLSSNFVHTNVAGATIEDLSADPDFLVWNDHLEDPTESTNGRVVFVDSQRGQSIDRGSDRHKVFFINCFIYYESRTKLDDATIQSIFAEIERVLNVNNVNTSRTYQWLIFPPTSYNNNPIAGKINFTVRAIETDVSAIS